MNFYFAKDLYDAWVYAYALSVEDDIKKGAMPIAPPNWEQVHPEDRKIYVRMVAFLNNLLGTHLDRAVDESEEN